MNSILTLSLITITTLTFSIWTMEKQPVNPNNHFPNAAAFLQNNNNAPRVNDFQEDNIFDRPSKKRLKRTTPCLYENFQQTQQAHSAQ